MTTEQVDGKRKQALNLREAFCCSAKAAVIAVLVLAMASAAQQSAPIDPVEMMTHDANIALQAGQDEQAERVLQAILKLDPHNRSALMNLGYISRRRKDRARALQYFAAACGASRKDAQCHLELGYTLQQTRSLADAELEFHKAACIPGQLQEQARIATINARQVAARQSSADPKAPVNVDAEVSCPSDGSLPSFSTIVNSLPGRKPQPPPPSAPIAQPLPPPSASVTQPLPPPPPSAPIAQPSATPGAVVIKSDPLPPYAAVIPRAVAIPKFPVQTVESKFDDLPAVLPTANYDLRALGYKALAEGNHPYAQHVFEVAAERYPQDALSLRQLAYLDIELHHTPEAIAAFESLLRIGAEDGQTSLQLAYLYERRRAYNNAAAAFRRAIRYSDPETSRQASAALEMLSQSHPTNSIELYAFPLYSSRFSDAVMDAQVKFVHRLSYTSPVSVFAGARLLADSASGSGALPQLYSDNAAMVGAGVRFQPVGAHYSIQAEANEAYLLPLGSSIRSSALVPDFRLTAGYFQRWQVPRFDRVGFEANGSVGFYSRYDRDAIAYAIPRETFRAFRAGAVATSVSMREMVVLDSDRYFYNNIAELAPGIDLAFGEAPFLSIRGEYVQGLYLNVHNGWQNPYGQQYHDVRIQVVFGKILQFHSGKRP